MDFTELSPQEKQDYVQVEGVSVAVDINKLALQKTETNHNIVRPVLIKTEQKTDDVTQVTSDLFISYMDKYGVIKSEEGYLAGIIYESYRDHCDLWQILGVLTEHYFSTRDLKTRKVSIKYGLPLKEALVPNNNFTLPDLLSLLCNIHSSINRKQRDYKLLDFQSGYLPRSVDVQDMIVRINNEDNIKSYVKKQIKAWELKRIDLAANCTSLLQDVQFNTMLDTGVQANVDKEPYLDNVIVTRKYCPYTWIMKENMGMFDVEDKLLTVVSQFPPVMFAQINQENIITYFCVGTIVDVDHENSWIINTSESMEISCLQIRVPENQVFLVFKKDILPKLGNASSDVLEMLNRRTVNILPDNQGKPFILANQWWDCADDFKNHDVYGMTIEEIKNVPWDNCSDYKKTIITNTAMPLLENAYATRLFLHSIFVKPNLLERFIDLLTQMVQETILKDRNTLTGVSVAIRLKVWFEKWQETLSHENPCFVG